MTPASYPPPVGTQKRSNARAIGLECDGRGRTANVHPVYGRMRNSLYVHDELTLWRVNTKE